MIRSRTARVALGMLAGAVLLAGCGGGGLPGAPSTTPIPEWARTAGATPTEVEQTTGTPTASPMSSSPDAGDDSGCLVPGSPWTVSNADLASQMRNLTGSRSVRIRGTQTFTVDAAGNSRFDVRLVITLVKDMSGGLTLTTTQTQRGHREGRFQIAPSALTPDGEWTGSLTVQTTFAINGRRASSRPTQTSAAAWGTAMHYACSAGALMVTVDGSPYNYLFEPDR